MNIMEFQCRYRIQDIASFDKILDYANNKAHMLELMPTMEALGFFELFEIRDEKIKKLIGI